MSMSCIVNVSTKKFIVVLVYGIKNNFEFTISDSTLVGEFKLENRNIIADLEP